MNKVFTDNGWKDYVYWQTEDRKTLKKINNLYEIIYIIFDYPYKHYTFNHFKV